MHRWTPFVRNFKGRHTGVNIEAQLSEMIGTFDFPEDIPIYAVNDNASNAKLAISLSTMLEYLCANHTLALAIKDTFRGSPDMQFAVDICKKLATFAHKSTVAEEMLKNKSNEMGVTYKKLIQSVETRWNSEYECMKSIIYLKNIIINL